MVGQLGEPTVTRAGNGSGRRQLPIALWQPPIKVSNCLHGQLFSARPAWLAATRELGRRAKVLRREADLPRNVGQRQALATSLPSDMVAPTGFDEQGNKVLLLR